MSTEVQPTTVIDVTRVLGRRPGAPFRAAVQTTPAGAADASIGTIRQTGAAVEQAADATFRAPAWKRAAAGIGGVVKTTALGTGPLRRAWRYQRATTFADQIREVETLLSITTDPEVRKALHAEIGVLEAARKETARSRHREPESIAKGAAGGVFVLTLLIVAFVVTPLMPAGFAVAGAGGAYVAGRREQKRRAEATVRALAAAEQRQAIEGGVEQAAATGGALPGEGALDGGALAAAFKAAGFTGTITVTEFEDLGDGATLTHFELPKHVTVTKLRKQDEVIAGALGRDLSMIDITKEGAANRGNLWMTDRDPFEDPRPSPLLDHRGAIDAWADGIPVAWAKRGNAVRLPISNSSFVIGGMTRSGKGVGAANLVAGAGLDVRINLRIAAGKVNGEWDSYAKTGVAATYFKPDPARLLALLKALLADMDRRNRVLGELSKSKVTPQTIERLGGIELLVIDELATFTRPGSCPERDEILAALIKLSAVAAGAGILMVLITQYPEVDVIPGALAMNCGTRWAMRVDNATQSNAILGGGASGSGRDASKFDPPRPGLGWLVNPFAGVTDLARSFDLDEDERGEVTQICEQAAELREAASRLTGQWDDPIEQHLLNATGLSSAAGGPRRDGQPGRALATLTAEQKQQLAALRGALAAMDQLGRDAAQLPELAGLIGGIDAFELGKLLRAAGAGGTVKVDIPGLPNRVNGYNRSDIQDALDLFEGH